MAQSADAAVKKHQAGIVPLRQTREDLGYTGEQIVVLTAFGAIMIATNVFNDALRVPLDSYLEPYRAR